MNQVQTICLTGGPCGGKSTSRAYISEKLANRGFYPLAIPEAPTLLMLAGLTPVGNAFDTATFQESVIKTMHALETTFVAAAKAAKHPRAVVICDRGIPDCAAYMPKEMYVSILNKLGLGSPIEVRDSRYEGVFHLRTAADGAEEFYTRANNAARLETIDEAKIKDQETLNAWLGHPHLKVIDNEGADFEKKLRKLDQSICRILGIPVPLEIERKYLLDPVELDSIDVPHEKIEIEQFYIQTRDPKIEVRVRKRGQNGHYVYYRTEKQKLRPGVRIETERFIDEDTYKRSHEYLLPGTGYVRKTRTCFVYMNQYFELDWVWSPKRIWMLEIELTEERDRVLLPPFLKNVREVTDNPQYSNFALATYG